MDSHNIIETKTKQSSPEFDESNSWWLDRYLQKGVGKNLMTLIVSLCLEDDIGSSILFQD